MNTVVSNVLSDVVAKMIASVDGLKPTGVGLVYGFDPDAVLFNPYDLSEPERYIFTYSGLVSDAVANGCNVALCAFTAPPALSASEPAYTGNVVTFTGGTAGLTGYAVIPGTSGAAAALTSGLAYVHRVLLIASDRRLARPVNVALSISVPISPIPVPVGTDAVFSVPLSFS